MTKLSVSAHIARTQARPRPDEAPVTTQSFLMPALSTPAILGISVLPWYSLPTGFFSAFCGRMADCRLCCEF